MARVNRRVVAIVVAVVLAAAAALAIFLYVQGLETEIRREADAVEVFVAKEVIPAGTAASTAINQGVIERETIPRRNVADGAISSLEQIQGQVATVSIQPGEQILATRWGTQAETSGLAEIPEGLEGISVEVGIPPGVANFPRQGDHVSMIAQFEAEQEQAQAEEGAEAPGQRAQFVVQNAEVLAVGRRVVTVTQEGQQEGVQQQEERVLFTLAVTPEDAEKVAFAVLNGQIYFTLLPQDLPEDYQPPDTPGRTLENIFE